MATPCTREPERVADDVALGFLSRSAAREHYGVVVDGRGALDLDATASLRAKLAIGGLACDWSRSPIRARASSDATGASASSQTPRHVSGSLPATLSS